MNAPTQSRTRLATLDGLRLVAALAVAIHHYTSYWALDGVHSPAYFLPRASQVTIYGFLGVELFFMISGFAICMSSWGRRLADFFVSRVTRLYPAYWTCIVITAAVTTLIPISGHIPQRVPLSWTHIGINLTMLQEPLGVPAVDNVYWTLWAELRFYLLFALVVAWGVTYRRTVIFLTAWMLAAGLANLLNEPLLKTITVSEFAGYFVAGVAMFLVHRVGPTPLLWAIIGVSWLVNMHQLGERVGPRGFDIPFWPAMLIVSLGYVILLVIALGKTNRIHWTWLTVAGTLTYPFYLLHQRIGYTVIRHGYELTDLPVSTLISATVIIMLAVAWLVHRFVERPLSPRLRAALRHFIMARTRHERPPLPGPLNPPVPPARSWPRSSRVVSASSHAVWAPAPSPVASPGHGRVGQLLNCARIRASSRCHAGDEALTDPWISAGISESVSCPGRPPVPYRSRVALTIRRARSSMRGSWRSRSYAWS